MATINNLKDIRQTVKGIIASKHSDANTKSYLLQALIEYVGDKDIAKRIAPFCQIVDEPEVDIEEVLEKGSS